MTFYLLFNQLSNLLLAILKYSLPVQLALRLRHVSQRSPSLECSLFALRSPTIAIAFSISAEVVCDGSCSFLFESILDLKALLILQLLFRGDLVAIQILSHELRLLGSRLLLSLGIRLVCILASAQPLVRLLLVDVVAVAYANALSVPFVELDLCSNPSTIFFF